MSNYTDGTSVRSCGCRIYFGEDDFDECRLHANAAALLAAARAVLETGTVYLKVRECAYPGCRDCAIADLRVAVEAAEGRTA